MFVPNMLKKAEYSIEVSLPEIDDTENKKMKNIFRPPVFYKKMTRKNNQNPTALINAIQAVLKRELKNKDFDPESDEFRKMLFTIVEANPITQLKDPKAPAKNKTAYMFFNSEQRKKHVGEPNKELFTIIAKEWENLKPAEKKPYEKMAETDKKRYDKEMAKYTPPSHEELLKLEVNSKKKAMGVSGTKAESDKPKRPKGVYMFFSAEKRPILKEKFAKEKSTIPLGKRVQTALSEMWNGLDTAARKKWQDQYDKEEAVYKEHLKEYEQKHSTKTVPTKKPRKPAVKKASQVAEETPEEDAAVADEENKSSTVKPSKGSTKKTTKAAAQNKTETPAVETSTAKGKGKKATIPKGKKPAAPKSEPEEEEDDAENTTAPASNIFEDSSDDE